MSVFYQVLACLIGAFGTVAALLVAMSDNGWLALWTFVGTLCAALTLSTTAVVLRWMAAMYDLAARQAQPVDSGGGVAGGRHSQPSAGPSGSGESLGSAVLGAWGYKG